MGSIIQQACKNLMEGIVRIVSFYNQPWIYGWFLVLLLTALFFLREEIFESWHITSVWTLQKTRVFNDLSQAPVKRLLPIVLFCSLLVFHLFWLFGENVQFSYQIYFPAVGLLLASWVVRWVIRKLVAFVFMPPKVAILNMGFYRKNLLLLFVAGLLFLALPILAFPHFSKILHIALLGLMTVIWFVAFVHNLFAFFVQKPTDIIDTLYYALFVELLPIITVIFLLISFLKDY